MDYERTILVAADLDLKRSEAPRVEGYIWIEARKNRDFSLPSLSSKKLNLSETIPKAGPRQMPLLPFI